MPTLFRSGSGAARISTDEQLIARVKSKKAIITRNGVAKRKRRRILLDSVAMDFLSLSSSARSRIDIRAPQEVMTGQSQPGCDSPCHHLLGGRNVDPGSC